MGREKKEKGARWEEKNFSDFQTDLRDCRLTTLECYPTLYDTRGV